ncbi:hypothetical protein AAF712_016364, partial [Marasmius tenuissimus]
MALKGQEPHVDLYSAGWASPPRPEPWNVPSPSNSMLPPEYSGPPLSPTKGKEPAGFNQHTSTQIILRTIPGTPKQSQRSSGPPLSANMSPFQLNTPPLSTVQGDPLSPSRSRNEIHFGGSACGDNVSPSPAGPIRTILRAARTIGGDPTGLSAVAEDYLNSHGYDYFNRNTILTTLWNAESECEFIEKLKNVLPGTPQDEAG